MKVLTLFLLLLAASGCHFRQVRCVLCATHTHVDTTAYQSGKTKSITLNEWVGKGLHYDTWHKRLTKEFDSTGRLRAVKKECFVTSYRRLSKTMLGADSVVYNPARDSSTHYVSVYKRGELLKVTATKGQK